MSLNIRLKHSATKDKKPQAADLKAGELALNTHSASAAGYALDDTGAVRQMFGKATETQQGQAEIATQAEVDGGTDDERIVTPLKLATAIPAATETLAGKAEIATQAEVTTGTDDTRIVTPLKLATAVPAASTTTAGKAEIATQAEVNAGTDSTKIVTPRTATATFVNVAGDTMTGDLTAPNLTATSDVDVSGSLTVPTINDFTFLTAAEKLTATDGDAVVYKASTGALVLRSLAQESLIVTGGGSTTNALKVTSLDAKNPGEVAGSAHSNAVGFTQMQASCHGVFTPGTGTAQYQVGIFTFEWTGSSKGAFVASDYVLWSGDDTKGQQIFSVSTFKDIDPTKQYVTEIGISKDAATGTFSPINNSSVRVVYTK